MKVRHSLTKVFASRRTLMWAALAGLALRLLWALIAGDAYRYYDSDSYVKIADSLLAGNGFLWGDQCLGRPPLYPLLVAATKISIAGHRFLLLYAVQSVLGAFSVLLFAAGARRLVGRIAGGITAAFVAFDPFLIFFSGTVLSETLFIFFLSALFYFVVILLERPGFLASFLAGLSAGAAFLTRPSVPGVVALFAVTIAVWARPRWKGIAGIIVIALTCALVVAPWAVRNHRLTGRWVFTTLGVGASLYDGIGPQADGSSDMNFLHSMPELALMDEPDRDDYLFYKALDAAIDSPLRVLKLAPVKAWRFWSPVPNNEDFRSPLYVVISLLAVLPAFLFAVAAIFTGVLRRRDFFLLASPPVYFTLLHMVFVGSARYRCPMMPLVVIMAASFLAAFLSRGKKGIGEAHRAAHARALRAKTVKTASSHKRRGLWKAFRVFLLLILSAGVVAAAGYAYYVKWLADPTKVKALAIAKIGLLFPGKEIRIGRADFSLRSGLDLREVEIYQTGDSLSPIAKLDYVRIDFSHRALFRFALVPRGVTASGLYLDLVRGEDRRWNLALPLSDIAAGVAAPQAPPARKVSAARRQVARHFAVSLHAAFVSIDDRFSRYSLSFPVESVSAMSDDANPTAWNVTLDFGAEPLGRWHVQATADPAAWSVSARFNVAGLDLREGLQNRLPPPARSAYDQFTPSGLTNLSGEFAYDPASGLDFDLTASLDDCALKLRRLPVAVTGLTGNLRFTEAGCAFEHLKGFALGGDLECSGQTAGYDGQSSFRVALAASGMEPTAELTSALDEGIRNAVESFNPLGRFDLSASISRDAGPDLPVKVVLDIFPKGVSAVFKGFPYPVDDVSGRIAYSDGTVRIDALSGRNGPAELAFNGSVTDIRAAAHTSLVIAARGLPLDEKLRVLLPEKAAATWSDLALSGVCELEVRLDKIAAGPTSLEIDADLRDASVTPRGFPYPLSSGSGTVKFADDTLSLDSLCFSHDDARVCVSGKADAKQGSFDLDLSATDVPLEPDLIDALPRGVADFISTTRLSGVADAALTVSRSPEGAFEFRDLQGTLSSAAFVLPQLPLEFAAAGVFFAVSENVVEVTRFDGLLFTGASAALLPGMRFAALSRPPAQVAATGSFGVGPRRDWETRFGVTRLFIDRFLAPGLPAPLRKSVEGARVSALVDISGESSFDPEGAGTITYAVSADCVDGALTAGWPFAAINGEISVAGRSDRSGAVLRLDADLSSVSVALRNAAETHVSLATDAGEVRIERFETRMLGGTLSGQGRVDLHANHAYGFSASVHGMDFAQIVDKAFGFRKKGLSGIVNARVSVLSPTGKTADIIGSADADIFNGTLWEVPVVLAMMNVLNLKFPERTMFDSARVRLVWTGDGAQINELSMASRPATIFGTGFIDGKATLDMMFYSRPGQIPIVSLLAGEVGKNIVRAHITGPFAQPQVTLVPSGLFARFLNALRPPRLRQHQ